MTDPSDARKIIEDVMRPYHEEIGNLVVDWNTMQDAFCRLFCALMETDDYRKPLAIWHSLGNDRSQRELVKRIAPHCSLIEKDKKAIEQIEWAVRNALGLGDNRDDAVHSPYVIVMAGEIRLEPYDTFGHPRAKGLKDKELISEFQRIRENIRRMVFFVYKLEQYLVDLKFKNAPPTLPDKPFLPSREQKKT
jgi:hypothetical protein